MYGSVEVIPYLWKQPFTTEIDPSARKLTNYEAEEDEKIDLKY
jgi:hypothetical protein